MDEKLNNLLQKYLNVEFGSYKVTKYLGYYANGNQKYKRHYFETECKFCGVMSHHNPGNLNQSIKIGRRCSLCSESVNIHTNEKKCKSCETWLPATHEYFVKSKNRRFGIHYYCRKCHHKKNIRYRENPDNRKKEYQQKKEREKVDPLFKLQLRIRVQIKNYVNRVNGKRQKECKTTQILGCSFLKFKEHIEKKFTDNMSWDNYGKWHYEHIIPVSLGKTEREVYELCHYTNYRPLWGDENLSKGTKIFIEDIDEENKIRYKKFLKEYLTL